MTPLAPQLWHRTLLTALLLPAPAAPAAHPNPVHWTLRAHGADTYPAGTRFAVDVLAGIDPGWHIYALDEPDGGPIATDITVAQTDPVTLLTVDQTPTPQKLFDPFYKQPLELFTREAHFTLQLRTGASALPPGTRLHLRVRYQACSATACLPPRTEFLEFPLFSRSRE